MIWLEMLRTPMAAPETRVLKAMRLTILACVSLLAMTILALAPLRSAIGVGAGGIAAGLLAAVAIIVPIYATMKNRADNDYLDAVISSEDKA